MAQWRKIVAAGQPPPLYERWTDEDKQWLVALQYNVIGIKDTMFRCEVAPKKRELEAAADHFTREEREAMGQKLDAIDAAKAITQCGTELETAAPGERAAPTGVECNAVEGGLCVGGSTTPS